MEALLSILFAVAGLLFGLLFLWDLSTLAASGGGRRRWIKAGAKLVIALLLLHFHFELDILD